MNKIYRISWERAVLYHGEIVINDMTDPAIMAESHMREGELIMRCHKINVDKAEEKIVGLTDDETGEAIIGPEIHVLRNGKMVLVSKEVRESIEIEDKIARMKK